MIKQIKSGDLKELKVFLSHIGNDLTKIELLSDVILNDQKTYSIEVYTSENYPYYFELPESIISDIFSDYWDGLYKDFDNDERYGLSIYLKQNEYDAMTANAFLYDWAGDILKLDFYNFFKDRFFNNLLTELN